MFAEACDSLWAFSALRAAVETGMIEELRAGSRDAASLAVVARSDETMTTRILDVLAAYGFLQKEGDRFALSEEGRRQAARGEALQADIAVTFGQARELVSDARAASLRTGWRPADPEIIRSQATLSYAMSKIIAVRLAELWPDLLERVSREGAAYVDIGVGGAGGACAFAERFPKLRIVGIDPLPAALVEARANVSARGMTGRIELRSQRGDELTDRQAFDAAFVPAKFFDDAGFEGTLRALTTALRSDGYVMTAAWRDVGEPRASAVSRLRDERWGAGPRTVETVCAVLGRAGFTKIRIGPPQGSMVPILAQLV
jgi:precorrin-6B methylase 2